MRKFAAFLAVTISAYAMSFAIDLYFGGLFHHYPSTVFLPVMTWLIIGMVTGFAGLVLWPGHAALAVPAAGFAVVAVVGGMVGRRYDFLTGLLMSFQAGFIWLLSKAGRGNRIDD